MAARLTNYSVLKTIGDLIGRVQVSGAHSYVAALQLLVVQDATNSYTLVSKASRESVLFSGLALASLKAGDNFPNDLLRK